MKNYSPTWHCHSPDITIGYKDERVEDRCQFSLRCERGEMDSERDGETERDRARLCPSLSLWNVTGGNIISQAALTQSVNQQRWKRTPDKHPLTHTHTHTAAQTCSVSRVFRYTLAGKQFHKLTYKVEKVRIDMNKQTSMLTLQADSLLQLTP